MIASRDRILTTHVGSLPRNETLSDLLIKREAGEAYDQKVFDAEMAKALRHVVAKQKEAGIDIGNDGEQQRVGFQTYVPQRMTGFAGASKRRRGREFDEFPELVKMLLMRFPHQSKQQNAPEAQAVSAEDDMGEPVQIIRHAGHGGKASHHQEERQRGDLAVGEQARRFSRKRIHRRRPADGH